MTGPNNLIIRACFPSQVFVDNLNVASGFLDRERAWHAYLDIWRPYFMYHAQFSHFITHLWFVRNHYEFKVVNPENIKLFQMCFENKQLLELHCCRERNSIISSAILLARKWLYLHNCMLLFLSSCFVLSSVRVTIYENTLFRFSSRIWHEYQSFLYPSQSDTSLFTF